jgi:hypothetical protein
MSNKETFLELVASGLPILTEEGYAFFNSNQPKITDILKQFEVVILDSATWKDKWDRYFAERWSDEKISIDWNTIKLPTFSHDHDGVVVIPKSMTLNKVFAKIGEKLDTSKWCSDDLETQYKSGRRTTQAYVIYCKYTEEGDADTKGKMTPTQAKESGKNWMRLLEWLLLSDFYFWETNGKHLDTADWTIFPEDIDSDGGAANALWFPVNRKVWVRSQSVDWVDALDRFRSVISL